MGDIWNCRWSKKVFSSILGDSCSTVVHPKDFSRSLRWLTKLTTLLQKLQREQFATRHHLSTILSLPMHAQFVSPRLKRGKGIRAQTLLEAWKIRYSRPVVIIPKHSTDFRRDDCAPRRPPLAFLHHSQLHHHVKSSKISARFPRRNPSVRK